VLTLVLLSIACQPVTPILVLPVCETSASDQGPGTSPSDPLPRSEVTIVPGWKIRVLDVKHGDQAGELIRSASAPGLSQDSEYLLVRVQAESINPKCPLEFAATGSRRVRRERASIAIRAQKRDLVSLAKKNGSAEGWIAFIVDQKEQDLLLIVSGGTLFASDYIFIALEEGALVSPRVELKSVAPTGLGRDRARPARVGETTTTLDWQATLVDVRRGREAIQTLRDIGLKSVFAPARDNEYVIARMRVQYFGTEDGPVRSPRVYLVSDSPIVQTPVEKHSPFYSKCSGFYPGGQYEDWMAFQIPTDLQDLILEVEFASSANMLDTRYFALGPLNRQGG
jgi:hypothetical protein